MAQRTFNGTKINVTFDEAASRQQLNSGENISTLFGKIKKIFSDLKAICFSGSYNDLSDKPSALPASGGNADRAGYSDNSDMLDGHHEDYFAKATNPAIEGEIRMLRAGNATTTPMIFAWEDTIRIRNLEDESAEQHTYTDFMLTPFGIFTERVLNGAIYGRQQIYAGRPYVAGVGSIPANNLACTTNHGFTPSAVLYAIEGNGVYFSKNFGDTFFTVDMGSTVNRTVRYIIFK